MKISFVMVVYNYEKYLLEQLIIFGKQTMFPDGVIIRSDSSADNTLPLINPFKEILPCNIRGYFNKALYLYISELFNSTVDDFILGYQKHFI